MRKLTIIILFLLTCVLAQAQTETFHSFSAVTIVGDTISLSQFAGKKVLVVNTASYCMYTPEFAQLAQLDSIYGGPNFAIIGFPCNDFGGQDPHNDSTINAFCTGTYGVQFQMMSKVAIVSVDTVEVYKWLQLASRNGVANAPVTWNFHKFCVDELGHWVKDFSSPTNPLDTAITNWILSPPALGVKTIEKPSSITLGPNPVQNSLNMRLNPATSGKMKISLLNLDGKLMDVLFSGEAVGGTSLNYDASKLSSGIYFIRVEGVNSIETLRLAVM